LNPWLCISIVPVIYSVPVYLRGSLSVFLTQPESNARFLRQLFYCPFGRKGRWKMKWFNGYRIKLMLVGFIISGLMGRAGISLAVEDTWTYKTDIPTVRGFTSGTVVDGKIYVIGGFPSHYSVTPVNEMYDPIVDTWTRMADMPSARCAHATCTYNGKIYAFGGVSPDGYSSAKNNVYVYDPQTDTWTQKADMPYANAFCGIVVVNETIYLIGGTTKLFSPPISTVMAYEPVTESWTQKADMPTARASLSACVVDGKIYTFGGADQNLRTYAYTSVESYDPSTNTWTTKTDMPTSRFGLGTCAMNAKIYAIGGVRDNLVVMTTNEMYDPVTDTWTTKSPLQERRQTFVLGSVGNKIYAIGGSYPDPQGEPVMPSSVEEYDTGLSVLSPDFNIGPVADAGLPRYAAQDPVVLDGIGSYDPDDSGTLNYTWRQTSGPSVEISEADTASPTISGFVQTDEIQECEFELVVSNDELTSLPDSVKVVIVPDFGENILRLANDSFDPNKPTCVWFWGGNCISGVPFQVAWASEEPVWLSKANIIEFSKGYEPDPNYMPGDVDALRTYYRCGDMIIVFLSSVAPDYKMPIQTMGFSTGGQPAIDVGIHLNLTYVDARYAVNRVTLLDARACRDFSDSIRQFLSSSVDGEQCWIDNHRGNTDGPYPSWPSFYPNVLRVGSSLPHMGVPTWYGNSLTLSDMNQFNQGVVGGAYWSVIGPGRNLQLASTPGVATYSFTWYGSVSSGYMDFYDEPNHPGRLPEPVTLIGPPDGAVVDANGVVLSCEICENAIGYQLLLGSEPYRVMDYIIVSDTPLPPSEVITSFPYEQTWWTLQVYDSFGSTIYADPVCVYPEKVEAPEPGLIDDVRIYNRAVRP
jgi:N-acetylneuraminic acid mutarotase